MAALGLPLPAKLLLADNHHGNPLGYIVPFDMATLGEN